MSAPVPSANLLLGLLAAERREREAAKRPRGADDDPFSPARDSPSPGPKIKKEPGPTIDLTVDSDDELPAPPPRKKPAPDARPDLPPGFSMQDLFACRKAAPWTCPACLFDNPAEDNYACANCREVGPRMAEWVARQRETIDALYTRELCKGDFGRISSNFVNRGRVRNGRLETNATASYWGPGEMIGTGHEPEPMAGERIAVLREGRAYPDIITSRTPFVPFSLPEQAAKAQILRIDYGGPRPFFVFRNVDGCGGVELARRFEKVFGASTLEAKSLGIHCGAISTGGACKDRNEKVWPRGMGLDYARGFKLGDMLTGLLELAEKRYGAGVMVDKGNPNALQMQVIKYRPGRTTDGGDFHPHLDGPQTGWVAIASIGHSVRFCVDLYTRCRRFFHKGWCPATGVKQAGDMTRWKSQSCFSCTELDLNSGDIILFHGNPLSGCSHGVLGTMRDRPGPSSLPRWAKGVRLSFQLRNMPAGAVPKEWQAEAAAVLESTA
ncbi:hypothetical protein DFJ74DRAFT_672503 [Hyaloraphidium curvatum]|nr:hypothetical protein DFJ74DRAFT_672503 [Hyaloraphidium curvatum]